MQIMCSMHGFAAPVIGKMGCRLLVICYPFHDVNVANRMPIVSKVAAIAHELPRPVKQTIVLRALSTASVSTVWKELQAP